MSVKPSVFALAILASVAFVTLGVGAARSAELKLLEPIAHASFDPTGRFVAADAFKLGRTIGGRTLSAVGWNFTTHFLNIVETDVPAVALRVWTLQYTMGDASLIRRLGGEARAAVSSIAHIHRLMEMGDGPSNTDGRSNFAYMRSTVDQRLWAVHWSVNFVNEWTIGAVYVPHQHIDWRAESRLLSPF